MAAAKKSKKKSSTKSDVKKSALKSDAKDRKKDKKKSADSKVRPSGRPDAKQDARKAEKKAENKAEKSTGKGKTAAKPQPGGKVKPAAADSSEPTRSVANGSSTKAGATASRAVSAPTASRAKAERRPPSGPAPSPRPAVRRSGLKTSTPAGAEVPSTVQRSDAHAQATWSAAHDSAVEQYGEGERAHRTAFAALKHTYEKVGDHWEAKAKAGPSDSRAASPGLDEGTPAGGVDATASRAHLYRLAQRLDIPGRSSMTKDELVRALQKVNDKATAEARRS
jgi:cation transport regulator ChaB